MTTIIKHDDFKIIQDERNPYIFNLDFSPYTNSQILIQSITKTNILVGTTITNVNKTLQFKATKVITFKQYKEEQLKKKHHRMKFEKVLLLVKNLVTQMEYLIKETNHIFIGYHSRNIIVIDDNKFIYLSNEHLHKIESNTITITCPFSTKDFFFSPELKELKEIPTKINYKTSYYSLACLIINIFQLEQDQEDQEDQKVLDSLPIQNTKLYWLLHRCLNEDPNKRSILFI